MCLGGKPMSVTIEQPKAPIRPPQRGINWEKWGWIYMRASGIVLVVLIFGHLFVNKAIEKGIACCRRKLSC